MYKVCGFTNYECTSGEEQLFGEGLSLEESLSLFLSLLHSVDTLDFTELDGLIDEWAEAWDWNKDDYYSGSYGGSIILYEKAESMCDFDREIISIRVERDPLNKTNQYGEIELGPEITSNEKEEYFRLSSK